MSEFTQRVFERVAIRDAREAGRLLDEVCEICWEKKTEDICHGEGCCSDPSPDGQVHACRGWSGMCCECGYDYAIGQLP